MSGHLPESTIEIQSQSHTLGLIPPTGTKLRKTNGMGGTCMDRTLSLDRSTAHSGIQVADMGTTQRRVFTHAHTYGDPWTGGGQSCDCIRASTELPRAGCRPRLLSVLLF